MIDQESQKHFFIFDCWPENKKVMIPLQASSITRPHAADDFEVIRARIEQLRREQRGKASQSEAADVLEWQRKLLSDAMTKPGC